MCLSVRGWRLTLRGFPSFTIVTGSSGSRYNWSPPSRRRTSTNGSRLAGISRLVQGAGVQDVRPVDVVRGGGRPQGEDRVLGGIEIVEQARVFGRQFRARPAAQRGPAGQHDLEPQK